MFVAETDAVPADGLEPWTNGGNLQPNAPLAMHPAATVLNYGQVEKHIFSFRTMMLHS